MSGSLLWDTKFIASKLRREKWTAEKSEVCGLLWAAHATPEVAVATRIEHFRGILLDLLRHEAAYFHWIERDRPLWDADIDWTWAVETIIDL